MACGAGGVVKVQFDVLFVHLEALGGPLDGGLVGRVERHRVIAAVARGQRVGAEHRQQLLARAAAARHEPQLAARAAVQQRLHHRPRHLHAQS